MSTQLHSELKKEFQLERMVLFSDAVFAIAITLLVLEIKIPEVHTNVTDQMILEDLGHLIPKFVGFFVSFMLIGIYWIVHHRMFGFVTAYNPTLLRLNLFFLFFIVLMPFSTALYSEYAGSALFARKIKVPMTFYVLNFVCIGILNYIMWIYISKPSRKLIDHAIEPRTIRFAKARAIAVPAIFFSMIPVAYLFEPVIAVYLPMFIPVVLRFLKRYYYRNPKKNQPAAE